MTLWNRIKRIVFGTKPKKEETRIKELLPMSKKHVQLAVYECPYGDEAKDTPAALVRYTTYSEGKVYKVSQSGYGIDAVGLYELDTQGYGALEEGLDVSIFTRIDISQLPKLGELTQRV